MEHAFAKTVVGAALAYSLIVALAIPLDMHGIPFVLDMNACSWGGLAPLVVAIMAWVALFVHGGA